MTESLMTHAQDKARRARLASAALARMPAEKRTEALKTIADELEKNRAHIVHANELDCQAAHSLVEQGEMTSALINRLKLDNEKLTDVIEGVRRLAQLEDPLGRLSLARQLDEGLRLYRVSCPIGVVLVIFESRPDALPQIVSLLVKSGNAGLIKGGSEAENSNRILFDTIHKAVLTCGFPEAALTLLSGRDEVSDILKLERYVDLVIPRGSSDLVRHIQENTRIPVLGHAEGICHIYVDESADIDMALSVIVDAKTQCPAACNAVETLLVHAKTAKKLLPKVVQSLSAKDVEVRVESEAAQRYGLNNVKKATDDDWSKEYCDLVLSVKVVDSLSEAVEHINEYGSGHTDAIITEDAAAYDRFFSEVNSAGIYWNVSTRFADGFRYGFGAEVGISTGKLHPRGPVGVEGLTTYKYKLIGRGHVVEDYVGQKARKFQHTDLPLS